MAPRTPADRQLGVSSFELHHTTRLFYPDDTLVYYTNECMSLLVPCDIENRYEPLPLIANKAVQIHAGRDSTVETGVFLRTKVDGPIPAGPFMKRAVGWGSFQDLRLEMGYAADHIGETTLHIVVFCRKSLSGRLDRLVRLRRTTTLRSAAGVPFVNQRIYEVPYEAIQNSKSSQPWFKAMWSLFHTTDDHSYRHVRAQLESQNVSDWEQYRYRFKTPRKPDYARLLDIKLTAVQPETISPDDEDCMICTGVLGTAEAPHPVALPCKHTLCRDCALRWVEENNGLAACPLCKARILTDQSDLDDVNFGLVNGVYEFDCRFTEHENFERSCADLDKELAENAGHEGFSLDVRLIEAVWMILATGAALEDDKSTPTHLNPLYFQEFGLAQEVVEDQADKYTERRMRCSDFYTQLLKRIYRRFVLEFRKAGLDQTLSIEEEDELLTDPTRAECLGVRPNFYPFICRMLNRTLQFLRLRRCDCSKGMHKHGLRDYYNPADYGDGADEDSEDSECEGSCSCAQGGVDVEMQDG